MVYSLLLSKWEVETFRATNVHIDILINYLLLGYTALQEARPPLLQKLIILILRSAKTFSSQNFCIFRISIIRQQSRVSH
jgi:hypothetical protein